MLKEALRQAYHLVPDDYRKALLVRRRARTWLRSGIVFIHIPKAAGTSMNNALYGRFMGHVRAADLQRWGSPSLRALPSFAITRNPWDRLVSAYRFARRGAGVGGEIQAAVARPELYQGPEFDNFERFVTEWLSARDVRRLDYIFQPQSLFVCDEKGKVLVDHLGKVEDLSPTYDFIEARLGRRPVVEPSNRSGSPVDYRSFYTPALIDLVGQIYEQDVRTFGYQFSDPASGKLGTNG